MSGSLFSIQKHRAVSFFFFFWKPEGAATQNLTAGSIRGNVTPKESHSPGDPPEEIHTGSRSQKNKVHPRKHQERALSGWVIQ